MRTSSILTPALKVLSSILPVVTFLNLVRTKAQFKLLQGLEDNYEKMQQIVKDASLK